jgi:uncharacterized repeat protein (TIGR03803 family)
MVRMAPLLVVAALLIGTLPTRAQSLTPLHKWPDTSRNDSGFTAPAVMSQGQDGELYATNPENGTFNAGSAFRITTLGVVTPLYNFCLQNGCADGIGPGGGLTLGTDGNLYGTTRVGGTHAAGTIFKVSPSGTWAKLYDFTGVADGGGPSFTLFQVPDGNFYGVNPDIFNGDYGVFYKLTPKTKPPYALKVLTDFNFTKGAFPNLPTLASDGNFYGTTAFGGDPTCRCGVVYKITPSGTLTVLHNFKGGANDGFEPVGVLVQANDGNLYGATYEGGAANIGTIFKISTSGTFTLLHSFAGFPQIDGALPYTGMILGSDGNLYGTTTAGGKGNFGDIYEVTVSTGKVTTLWSFCTLTLCADGFDPQEPLVQHTNGKFYGNTFGNSLGGSIYFSLDTGLGPFASIVVNASAKVGATVELLGQGFTGTTGVLFNGTPALSFTVVSDTYLTVTVPNGATDGPISIETPGGTLVTNHAFILVPVIKTLNPSSGKVGSQVTIGGSSFTGATKVVFGGGKSATFTVNSDSQITATVPTGAKTGKIQVTTPGGTASSPTSFTVTP